MNTSRGQALRERRLAWNVLRNSMTMRFVAGLAEAAMRRQAQSTAVTSVRANRQDALLDAALKETFPASDPVSVARVD